MRFPLRLEAEDADGVAEAAGFQKKLGFKVCVVLFELDAEIQSQRSEVNRGRHRARRLDHVCKQLIIFAGHAVTA